jgi:hypothetical protein
MERSVCPPAKYNKFVKIGVDYSNLMINTLDEYAFKMSTEELPIMIYNDSIIF